ncbi:MAG: zinc-binding dehydrogenase [Candidatus Poribacteria bacterium]|nr:zinc-binding dehydrogenase [Candidatus Poribacteria bacterium]
MKKAAILGERQAGLIDAPDPKAVKDWAVVKVETAPMCTEYKGWLGGWKAENLGHEAAGVVVDVAQEGSVKVGDRVVVMPQYPCGVCELCVAGEYIHCENTPNFETYSGQKEGRATMAQYLLKPMRLLPKIPDDLTIDQASLACCSLGPSYSAMDRMNVKPFDTVLITGLGPVGQGSVVNATFRGARVIAVDLVEARRDRAKQLGAAEALDAADEQILQKIRDLTDGRGVNYSLDCSGSPKAHRLCIDATRRKGIVMFVGECGEDTAIRISQDMIRKGLTLMGNWHYNLSGFPNVMKVVRESPAAKSLVSSVLPMSEIQKAMETCASDDTGKVLLHPWE